MKIEDFYNDYPNQARILNNIETQIEISLAKSKYKGFLKLLDSFIYIFTDDLQKTLKQVTKEDSIIILYSEAFKRIRYSSLLAIKGYFTDATALLRSVFELNKAINAIQNKIISISEYFSAKRDESFKELSHKKKLKLINEHIKATDNKINNFDDKDVPEDLKDSLRTFKSNMHISVHKSMANIALYVGEFLNKGTGDLFRPHSNMEIFETYLNDVSFMILMFLKNLENSTYLFNENESKIADMINFIETSYLETELAYFCDIVNYIKLKYI